MTPELWRKVDDLFQRAMERKPEERTEFLQQACGGDMDLLQQVELLLSGDARAATFLEKPALDESTLTWSPVRYPAARSVRIAWCHFWEPEGWAKYIGLATASSGAMSR